MKIPPGIENASPSKCKLLKSLYGLTSRALYDKLSILLMSCGYKRAHSDHNLFIKAEKTNLTALIVYVDDIVLTRHCQAEMVTIKQVLDSHF